MRTSESRTCCSFAASLSLVREILETTASTNAEVRAGRLDADGARLQHPSAVGLGKAAFHLRHPRADAVAGQATANEDDEAVQASDAVPAVGERVDLELELLPLPNGRGHLRPA